MNLQVSTGQAPLSPKEEYKPYEVKPGQMQNDHVRSDPTEMCSSNSRRKNYSTSIDRMVNGNSQNSSSEDNPNISNNNRDGQIDSRASNAIITPNKADETASGSDSWKVDINQIDQEVSKILSQLEQIEQKFTGSEFGTKRTDTEQQQSSPVTTKTGLKEIHNLIDNFKSTILRLNLKNTLVKNQLLSVKDDYTMERCMLLSRIENLEKALRIIQDENNAVNSRNLKLIKYIRTLKNEKLKLYISENRRLKEHIERLEQESLHNMNALRINHPQRYPSISSPMNSTTSPVPPIAVPGGTSMQYPMGYREEDADPPYQIRQQINSPTNFNMLDTLGRLATEYLHNEYPEEEQDERLERA
ncbi:hypothetical protein PMKS-003418 [Pichia membranifaciens]|uniref:Uncharacterized protein n=1 Tax=Pichia membranifaciens TaxID=4926 RepID=A0A1Q2YK42_9ASCO|nr:hypothetical protein PMKS-003418 [Pichia membranifaciens]